MTKRLVIVSPCRDEAEYLARTIDSVVSGAVVPDRWIIVDDGSTDDTPRLLADYAARYPYIEILRRPDRGRRAVGPGVVDAFYAGYETIERGEFEYVCKLDLDLDLPPRYFEILLDRMDADPQLATASGKAYVDRDGVLVAENHGDETSLGMTKLYRVTAFEAIGGFVRDVMWDGIDCHRCRMLGLVARSWDEPELRFVHLRPMGSSQRGVLTGRARHGYGQYFMGTGFLYLAASAATRLREPPVVLGSLAMMWGWLRSAARRLRRYDDPDFRRFLRRYQRLALRQGKTRAAETVRRERLEANR